MKTWIAKIKDSGPWIVFFEIFVIAQLLLIFVFNLTHLKYEAGFDSSAAMAQAMEIWNQKMFRWIKKGSKGIALIDNTSGPKIKLR